MNHTLDTMHDQRPAVDSFLNEVDFAMWEEFRFPEKVLQLSEIAEDLTSSRFHTNEFKHVHGQPSFIRDQPAIWPTESQTSTSSLTSTPSCTWISCESTC